jgi:hypothetical protein
LRIKNSSPWAHVTDPNLLPLRGWEFKRHVHVLGYCRGRHLTNRWCLGASCGDAATSYRSMQNLVDRLSIRNHWSGLDRSWWHGLYYGTDSHTGSASDLGGGSRVHYTDLPLMATAGASSLVLALASLTVVMIKVTVESQ